MDSFVLTALQSFPTFDNPVECPSTRPLGSHHLGMENFLPDNLPDQWFHDDGRPTVKPKTNFWTSRGVTTLLPFRRGIFGAPPTSYTYT